MIVPAGLVVRAAEMSGHKLSPSTLRSWVKRGLLHRKGGGYDLRDVIALIDSRQNRLRRVSCESELNLQRSNA